jgi:predicted MFS family arabinose efflux permease
MTGTSAPKEVWRTAIAGALTLATLLGIGRFAYTPLLPMMLEEHIVTLAGGGLIATLHYIGYFLGAAACMLWRFPPTAMIRSGLAMTVALLFGMAITDNLFLLMTWRLLAGLATGWAFVHTTNWFLQRFNELHHPAMAGFIFCGPGIGIFVTGIGAGSMIHHDWHASAGWTAFGLLALACTAFCWRIFDHNPHAVTPAGKPPAPQTLVTPSEPLWQAASYGMSGLGYIITATFLPVIARIAIPDSMLLDFFWPLFGLCVAAGALISTRIPVHYDQRLLLAISYVMQAAGVIICMVIPTETGFAISSILLGLPFTAITLFGMREARRLPSPTPGRLVALMVTTYSFGQIIGPPLATYFATLTGSFNPSLCIAAGALLLGAVIYTTLSVREHLHRQHR